jgi:succinate dehydrogenase / fumarate reductase, flavoprotein subunit
MEDYDPDRMELSSRDVVARAIYKEVEAGRGSEHGGAYLDISHRGADYIKKKLPSMHEQFLKLADVDITIGPMEVGPTIHYVMGGIRVEPETGAASIPGLFAAGEVAGGLHGANRLGGNSLSDILVFGKRAGDGAAAYARERGEVGALVESTIVEEKAALLKPFANFEAGKTENPFVYMAELQAVLGDHNGISRTGDGLEEGLRKLLELKTRVGDLGVPDSRMFNPGWHACRDQVFMTRIAEAMFRCGIERKESRGSHWRLDFLDLNPDWGKHNMISILEDGEVKVDKRRALEMPAELAALIDDKPAVFKGAVQAAPK